MDAETRVFVDDAKALDVLHTMCESLGFSWRTTGQYLAPYKHVRIVCGLPRSPVHVLVYGPDVDTGLDCYEHACQCNSVNSAVYFALLLDACIEGQRGVSNEEFQRYRQGIIDGR